MDVLIVEDDTRVARLVARTLSEAGHRVEVAHDGPAGLERGETGIYDLIVLDVMLPHLDGLAVCRQLRRGGVRSAILMLTARDAVADRVKGLDAGADDYLVKPFALEELLARSRALDRRTNGRADVEALRVGNLTLDLARYEARRGDSVIQLTAKEFTLLRYLMRHFYRVDRSRNRAAGGAGPGLPIAKALSALHGGQIPVASAVGDGTTVTVRLLLANKHPTLVERLRHLTARLPRPFGRGGVRRKA